MKLRFRKNSLRLRINQREIQALAAGSALEEQIHFPGGTSLAYILQANSGLAPDAQFQQETIRITAPREQVEQWAGSDEVGLYFELRTDRETLKIAIEKDLVCIDGPEEERDPDAFPRRTPSSC